MMAKMQTIVEQEKRDCFKILCIRKGLSIQDALKLFVEQCVEMDDIPVDALNRVHADR